jgi:N utilization substance protein B
MSNRRKARELAMQVLFLWDAHGSNDTEMALHALAGDAEADDDTRRAALAIAEGAWGQREASDQWIERLAPQWPPRRQPPVDRNILRLGIWELTNTQTPPKVAIDEAIELAKRFSTDQSPAFVNGVLDAVMRERKAIVGDAEGTRM